MNNDGWIGVDLDGTLAEYNGWTGDPFSIGKPVPRMVERVRQWLREDKQVWIFTARVSPEAVEFNDQHAADITEAISRWCEEHIGRALPVTYRKNPSMIELWDDRVVQVIPNTGVRADGKA
jgi:hypothetical protein